MHSMWTNRAISCCVIGRRGETNWTWAVYYFPTTLCGVLVFDSVSRVPPPPASSSSRLLLLPPPPAVHNHLSHTTLSHTIFHIQRCQPPSFTYNFVNHHLSHTTLSHTIFHTQLCRAGVALGDIHRHLAWQAWHLATSTFVSRGRPGTYGTGLALVARLGGLGRR